MSSNEWGSGYTAGKKATCLDLRTQLADLKRQLDDLAKRYVAQAYDLAEAREQLAAHEAEENRLREAEKARADKAEARADGYEQAMCGVAAMRGWAGRLCGHCQSTVGRLSEVYDAIDAALNSKGGDGND